MFIPDPIFFHSGSPIRIKEFKFFNPQKLFLCSRKYFPGCSSRIRIRIFYPYRIPDPGVKKAPGPGSGSATLVWLITIKSPYMVFLDITSCRRRCHSRICSLTRGPRSGWVVCEVDAERAAAGECGADLAAAVAAGAAPEVVPAAAADPLGGRLSTTPAYVWLYNTVSVYRYIPKYLSRLYLSVFF
jgi:hypothetical protein